MGKNRKSAIRNPKSEIARGFTLVELPAVSGRKREAFTLVELLVVITIIGILAALITTAAVGALKTMRKTTIKTEITELSNGLDEYKNKTTAYPPNCQTDDATMSSTGAEPATTPIDEYTVLNDLKRHFKQAFPRHQEPDTLIARLAGLTPTGAALPLSQGLQGGMTAGEAVVFWLGGFSTDPKYPISGEGGPSYDVTGVSAPDKVKKDPIESRKYIYPFDVNRLGPRASDGYFNEKTGSGRYIEYQVTINGLQQTRRINFWQYAPSKSEQPYLYFDTSRHPAYDATGGSIQPSRFDPPAATTATGLGPTGASLEVYAFKKANPSFVTGAPPVVFINPDKFQVMHSGLDGVWDDSTVTPTAFQKMCSRYVTAPTTATNYLLFPNGPFIGDIADTQVNFNQETTIEDSVQ
jgi:prepilin-type N-terminal cleavage/methylation domain-containing protein